MLAACLLAGVSQPVGAQTADFVATDATLGRVVFGEPFSADGITTMTQMLADGTRIERTVPSKFYRDSQGRVRREQTVLGLTALTASKDAPLIITIVDSVQRVTYTLNPATKLARRTSVPGVSGLSYEAWRAHISTQGAALRRLAEETGGFAIQDLAGPPSPPPPAPPAQPVGSDAPPPPPPAPPAGTNAAKPQIVHGPAAASAQITQGFRVPAPVRRVQGLEATGERTVQIIRTGEIGNDRPIHVTSERWVSFELGLVLESRYDDPRTGTVEFRLTNIQRAEPPRELFTVPVDYKIVDAPPPPPPPPPAKPLDPAGPPPPPPPPPAPPAR
jgi:hypothetical protein